MIIPVYFGGNDIAAAATAAALRLLGIADTTDISTVTFPFAVQVVGVMVQGKPASGDTLTATVMVNGTAAANTPSVQITNAAPAASWFGGSGDAVLVPASQSLGVDVLTTTGGTYTATDDLIIVLVQPQSTAGYVTLLA